MGGRRQQHSLGGGGDFNLILQDNEKLGGF